jgi:hypothetical protein
MEIYAIDGRFAVGAFRHGWDGEWNPDNTLSVWATGDDTCIHVTTNRGTFIEALNAAGDVVSQGGDGDWCYFCVSKEPIRLRYKILPTPELTKAELDKHRQVVTRYLVSEKPFHLDLPDSLPGMIDWMKAKLAEIPKGCRHETRFRFDTTTEYGETYPQIEITFQERETDEEVIRRVQIEAERDRVNTIKKRAELEKLKSELEPH